MPLERLLSYQLPLVWWRFTTLEGQAHTNQAGSKAKEEQEGVDEFDQTLHAQGSKAKIRGMLYLIIEKEGSSCEETQESWDHPLTAKRMVDMLVTLLAATVAPAPGTTPRNWTTPHHHLKKHYEKKNPNATR
jgi:hypothetical protein